MEVHAPLCPLDLRMTRCNVLQGAVHSKHGTVAAEAKTNKILLYKSTINATASAAHRGGRSSARNTATASSSSSSTPTPAATAFPAQPSTYSVLTTIPEDIRLVQWGIDLPGKLTPLLVASVRALYIYLVKSNGAVHSLAVRAPLDAAEVTSAAWHPTEPGMFAIVTMHGTFVYTLPHKVFASSFFGAAAPNSSAAAACDRVCAIKGKFRSCCWSGNGNHLIVAPTAASQDLRCYVRSSLQPTPDSDDDDELAAAAAAAASPDAEPEFASIELGPNRKIQVMASVPGEDAVVVVSSLEETQLYTQPEQSLFDADASVAKVSTSLFFGNEAAGGGGRGGGALFSGATRAAESTISAMLGGGGGGGGGGGDGGSSSSKRSPTRKHKHGRSPLSSSVAGTRTSGIPLSSQAQQQQQQQPLTGIEKLFSFPTQNNVSEVSLLPPHSYHPLRYFVS